MVGILYNSIKKKPKSVFITIARFCNAQIRNQQFMHDQTIVYICSATKITEIQSTVHLALFIGSMLEYNC